MNNDLLNTKSLILVLGIIAISGAFLGVLADLLSGWSDNPSAMDTAFSLTLDNIKGLFINKPRWTYVAGNYLAIFFLPFHIVGMYLIYSALKPAGKKTAMFFIFPAMYIVVLGSGYHGTYAFVGDIIKSGNEHLMNNMLDYWLYWGMIIVAGFSVITIFLFVLVVTGRSIYPKWIAIFSPLGILLITMLVTVIIPEKFTGIKTFFTVTGLNLPLLIFYSITTYHLLKSKYIDLGFP